MSRDGRDTSPAHRDRTEADRDRASGTGHTDVAYHPARALDLPRGDAREPVRVKNQTYHLRGSEARTLATIGAFRVVPAGDLRDAEPRADVWRGDLLTLWEQGLIERTRVAVDGQVTDVVALTRAGKTLLESRQDVADGPQQAFHASLVKPRELSHDAQLYRMFQAEAGRIADEGGRVTRVVLDYELKHDYQTFLNRPDHAEGEAEADLRAFAESHGLPVVDGHLELPDLRIEYETPDGRLEYRDVELVTEHYSRAQLAGKAQAGFTLYRASGSQARTGGTPFDPRYLERL